MAKNDHPHAVRLRESLEKHGKCEDAARFAEGCSLSKSATAAAKFQWAQKQCAYLTEHFDDETIRQIRMDCACGPEMDKAGKLKAIYERERDLSAFVKKANRLQQGFSLEDGDESIDLIYPQCYCSCVKRVDTHLSAVWCYCTLGYAKRMFSYIFDREVQAELISSVKMGDAVCRIRIRPQKESDERDETPSRE